VHGTDLSPRHPLLPPAMTSNLLPMLPVYFVTDLAGPYLPLVLSLWGRLQRGKQAVKIPFSTAC
ncbi:MAG: hypothetical protein ACLQAT_24250, partial [Candidatus Binataceae bacterium]